MDEVTIVIPSKDEDPRYVAQIKRQATCPVIVIYDAPYGEAIKRGIAEATTEYILTMDADGQHDYRGAQDLYEAQKICKADLIIGHRRLKERNPVRVFGSFLINAFASVFAQRWVVDLNSGIRLFKRSNAVNYKSILCDDFSFTTSLAMAHLADDLKVEWFPINVYPRMEGKSHVKFFRHTLITVYYIIRIGFALRTRRFRSWLRSLRK